MTEENLTPEEKAAQAAAEKAAEAKAKAEQEAKAKAEAAAKAKAEKEAKEKAKAEADAKAKEEQEEKDKSENTQTEKVNAIFKEYPEAKELHCTADGFCFFLLSDASNHARTLEDKTVKTISNETIVRQCFRKFFFQMNANVMQIKMLEIFEGSEVKKQQNCHNFAVRHFASPIALFFTIFDGQYFVFLYFF